MRQLFLPFTDPLDPQHPTDQQRQALEKARALSANIKSCPQMEAAAKIHPSARPVDPGEVRLETVNPPPFRDHADEIAGWRGQSAAGRDRRHRGGDPVLEGAEEHGGY